MGLLESRVLSVSGCLFWENLEVLSTVDSNGAKTESPMGSLKLGHPRDHNLKTVALTSFLFKQPTGPCYEHPPVHSQIHHFGYTLAQDSLEDVVSTGVNLHRVGGLRRIAEPLQEQQTAQIQLNTPMSNSHGDKGAFRKAATAKICLAQVCKRTYISTYEKLLLMQLK